ncbi:hypothetical protein F5J12DRAFT_819130 [Pisolithus orientalis]|uniref:uncharacterized protein n=1 Tax=Pisolithus orientalis TaxID=936130 RepID=UPI0022251884|nr:uncharacterized protein F5J12DRAFT_819130 [Pisolithus orientalis]KAI6012607.1 hypothetical protein F5J12DRAFT_819130 [Pisolithus orientalis]
MNFSNLEFTLDDLNNAGLLGDGVSGYATQAISTMKERPELLNLSLFALECMNLTGQQREDLVPPGSPTLSDVSTMSSNLSAVTIASDAFEVSPYTPSDFERKSYYNGITGDGDHPELVYRSDCLTTPFLRPSGRYAHLPVKSVRGVFKTSLNGVWSTVGPKICELIMAWGINWSSIDPARFFTHGPPGEEEKGSLGPVVIWIGVVPNSTSSDTAHNVSQEILKVLRDHGVEDVVVEWRAAVLQRLAGLPLMRHVGNTNVTHHVRRFLTPLHGVPLATQGMEKEDAQGTLTLWFHENRDKDGNPSNRVFGVSNCHVLRKNTTVEYDHKGGAPRDYVRVCGVRRFQRGLDEITKAIGDHSIVANFWAREIVKLEARLEAKGGADEEDAEEMKANRQKLDDEKKAIAKLEAFYTEVKRDWSDIKLHRNIGHVQYAAPITVDIEGGTKYTSDWGAFLAAEAKVRDQFEGNVVDLGSKYSVEDLTAVFYSRGNGPTMFKYPEGRKLRIMGCATEEDLANPTEIDSEGRPYLTVGKDGNTTDLTFGRYAGLESFTRNEVGVPSVELGIYNMGVKTSDAFCAKGDSGSLVWYMKDGKAFIVGQLHSADNKGASTSNHVAYCTPGWYLLLQIKKKFKYADFYRTTW